MRLQQQQGFRGIPSNQPLKSPSPDLKGKNAIGPTMSPHQASIRKSFSQFTPPKSSKKASYIEYSTLPITSEPLQSNIETNLEKIFGTQTNQKLYSSTHAKGHYNFQLPKELMLNSDERNRQDLISTGKKSHHKRNHTHAYAEQSPLYKTQFKSHREEDLFKTINEKDMIIHQLKGMINLMTENGKHLKNSQRTLVQEEYESMKNQVKILTIQNQKLAEIIERMNDKNQKIAQKNSSIQKTQLRSGSKQRAKTQQSSLQKQRRSSENLQIFKQYQQKLTNYEEQITALKSTLQHKQTNFERQIDQMIKSHKSLALQCKMYENEKERFSRQNERLINLLRLKQKEKQTCYANYSYVDKKQYESQESGAKNPSELSKSQSGSSNRLSIQKIKAQYEQNLKQYKQNVYNEVYSMFDTINATLEEINEKINSLEDKITEMERFRNQLKPKPISHLTSMEETEEEIKKSAIYIEDPPSSQRISVQSKSRQALSVILQESRRDNQKLELELSQLRRQVDMWRNTMRQKSQNEATQKTEEVQDSDEEVESYREKIKELEDLVDELREEKETNQKELIRLESHLLKLGEKHKHDSSLVSQLKAQIQSLRQELQMRRQESLKLRQEIASFQSSEEEKQKDLLNEIQRFQATIKQTEDNFSLQKQENEKEKSILLQKISNIQSQKEGLLQRIQDLVKLENQNLSLKNKLKTDSQKFFVQINKFTSEFQGKVQAYTTQIQRLQNYVVKLTEELKHKSELISLLEEERQALTIEKDNLVHEKEGLIKEKKCLIHENTTLSIEKEKISENGFKFANFKKSLVRIRNSVHEDNQLEQIKEYIEEIEMESAKTNNEKMQLVESLQEQRQELMKTKRSIIDLTQKVNSLQQLNSLYQKQLSDTKSFYNAYLKNHLLQVENDPLKNSSKPSIFKQKIHEIIDKEKSKITNLMQMIESFSFETQNQESVDEQRDAQAEKI